jgi:peptide/nickel transport system substrate-binding protein
MLLLILATLQGCKSGDRGPRPSSNAPLVIAGYRSINTFNPTNLSQAWQMEFGVGETLMTMSPEGRPIPWLLKSLVNRTPTEWVMTLRPGIHFQNGVELTAGKLAQFLEFQSAHSILAKAQLPNLRAVVTGPLQVTMTTSAPDSVVPRKLVQHNAFVVYDVDAAQSAGLDNDQALVASGYMTGPFRIQSFSEREQLLVRNEHYWRGVPPLPGIRVMVIPDEQARLAAVRAGEADWALQMPVEYGALLKNAPRARLIQAKWESSVRLELNQATFPMNEYAVRRALSLAIDYRQVASFMGGYMAPAQGLFPLAFPGALSNQVTDVDEAGRILEKAGWVRGADGIRTRGGRRLQCKLLVSSRRSDQVTIGLAVKQQVARAGIDVVVTQTEELGDILHSADWGAAVVTNGTLSQWSGSYETQLVRYHLSNSVQNYGHTADPELDALAASLIAEFDERRKLRLFQRLQHLMVEEKAYLIVVAMQRPSLIVGRNYFNYELSNWFQHVRWDTRPSPQDRDVR